MAGAGRRRCAVLGDPIAHSLSPVLHRAAYAAAGLDWDYDARRVPAGDLARTLAGLDDTWRGLSLTMPLKREALGLADGAAAWARLAGGANTLIRRDDGWWADNTDVPGAVAALRERTDLAAGRAAILGGGATATSTGLALVELGCRRIELLVRSPERAEVTRSAIADHPAGPEVTIAPLVATGDLTADVVVSTVPARAHDADLLARVVSAPVVFEVLYDPWPTPLAEAVTAAGHTLVTGLDLLAHQAALQFELFTGQTASVDVMRAAGESALAERNAR